MKWSGACSAESSASARERQRSGSGPRYSISLIASGVRRKAGTSAGRLWAARRLIIWWPSLPHPKEAGTAIRGRSRSPNIERKTSTGRMRGVYRQRRRVQSRGSRNAQTEVTYSHPDGKRLGRGLVDVRPRTPALEASLQQRQQPGVPVAHHEQQQERYREIVLVDHR